MKETKSDIVSLSNSKNSSLPLSLTKFKRSKIFQNKTSKKDSQSHKKLTSKEKIKKAKKKLNAFHIMNSQLQKHNSNPLKKNIMIINDIIDTKTNHFLAKFKDYLITDYVDEFLKRYFFIGESEELIPKFYVYYQNYLKFFCRGLFTDFSANKIVQDYGEFQAELYYNKNYGLKDKKKKKNNIDDKDIYNSSKSLSNKSNYKLNKIKILFTETVRNSINRIENSKLIKNYVYKYNTNEISNILYKQNGTMTLNDDTKIYSNDNLLTNESSLIHLIDVIVNKKRKKKKSSKNKNNYNINDRNIVNIYKNLLNQSPIKSARNPNCINKNVAHNKTTKKTSSFKIFNKNIPIIIKNKKFSNNISNELKDTTKTPVYLENPKISAKNFQSRNSKNNNNLFMKSNLTQKGYYRNTSKSISSRLGANFPKSKNNIKKFSSFNTNLNIDSQNKNKIKYTGINFKNIDSNLLSTSSSRKNNYIYSYHSNKNCSKKSNNRIKHYQYITYKNKIQLKKQNNKYRQSYSLSNSNSIFNNFHININNNIMLLNNNNNNIKHFISNKNNIKSFSRSKKKNNNINNYNYNPKRINKNISRNENIFDINKYRTEIKNMQVNIKNKKNINKNIYANKKFMSLEKSRSKHKEKNLKNKEALVRNKSNLFINNSHFKVKKFEKSEMTIINK